MKLNIVNATSLYGMNCLTSLLETEIPNVAKELFNSDIKIIKNDIRNGSSDTSNYLEYFFSNNDGPIPISKLMHKDQDAVLYLCKTHDGSSLHFVEHEFRSDNLKQLVESAQKYNPSTKVIFAYQAVADTPTKFQEYLVDEVNSLVNYYLQDFQYCTSLNGKEYRGISEVLDFKIKTKPFEKDYEKEQWIVHLPNESNVMKEPIKILPAESIGHDTDNMRNFLYTSEDMPLMKIVSYLCNKTGDRK